MTSPRQYGATGGHWWSHNAFRDPHAPRRAAEVPFSRGPRAVDLAADQGTAGEAGELADLKEALAPAPAVEPEGGAQQPFGFLEHAANVLGVGGSDTQGDAHSDGQDDAHADVKARGVQASASKKKSKSPRKIGSILGSVDLDESPDAPPVKHQIVAAMKASSTRVLDLFRDW